MTIDVDSSICQTYGLAKQGGSKFTYNHVRGYHPLLAVMAGTADVLHCRLRGGNANSGRGAAGFLTETFGRLRVAGATGAITSRADSGFYSGAVATACRAADVAFSITVRLNPAIRKAIAKISDDAWVPIPYFLDGADVAETSYRPFGKKAPLVRLVVRRVKPTPGSQLALLVDYAFHAFVTNRVGETVALEADHRRHAEVENAIRDLKYGVGLNHMPSGSSGPTPPGWASTSWPTTWATGPAASASVRASSPPTPSAGATCARPAASAGRPAAPPCTCLGTGPGPSSSSARWPSCGPWCSSPEHPERTAAASADPADHPQRENQRKGLGPPRPLCGPRR